MSSHILPRSSTRKQRPILRDLRNTLALQATESGRYIIEQGLPNGDFSQSPASPEYHRHRRANLKFRVNPITLPLNPSSKSAQRTTSSLTLDILGSLPVDTLAFQVSKYNESLEEENIFTTKHSSSMIINHGNFDIDLSLSSESNHSTLYQYIQALEPRTVPLNRRFSDRNALIFNVPPRSPTPSLSPPTASSSPTSDLFSKRSGRTFRLVPAQKDHFVHAVETDLTGCRIESPQDSPCSSSPTQYGFPPDMVALLQELDELAGWIQNFPYPDGALGVLDALTVGSTAPVSCPNALERLGNDLDDHFVRKHELYDKGKRRRLTESTDDTDVGMSEYRRQLPTSRSAIPPVSAPLVRRQSVCYIYEPRSTPSFLVGSSTSPIAYPTEGYRSPPRAVRLTPVPSPISLSVCTPVVQQPSGRRSVPNVSPQPLVSPLSGIKAFFKRSRSNTMSAPRTTAFGRDKKKFGWLKI